MNKSSEPLKAIEHQAFMRLLAKKTDNQVAVPMSVLQAYVLVENLQLALSHPGNTGEPADMVQKMIDLLKEFIVREVPEVEMIINKGQRRVEANNPSRRGGASGKGFKKR